MLTVPEAPTASEQATTVLRPRPRPRHRARRRVPWVVAALATVAIAVAAVLALDADPGPAEQPRQTPPAPRGPQAGATPEETARNLSEWLRANARGGG